MPSSKSTAGGEILADGTLRNALGSKELTYFTSAGKNVKTLYDTFQFGVKRNPNAKCMGKRKDVNSPFEFKTYKQIHEEAAAVGSYLKTLGIESNERVGISGKNAPEYLTTIQACFWAGATTVPIYDTFGEPECTYICKQANVQAVFVSEPNLGKILEWTSEFDFVKKIVVWGATEEPTDERVITYEKAVKEGKAALSKNKATPPKPDDLCIIMYTSGTTGMPKGVMLKHSALVAAVGSLEKFFTTFVGKIDNRDAFLSYLPLAHVFDYYCECMCLFLGAQIGYYRGDQKTLVDDIGELKPTIFVGVPRVFERIYKRVDDMMQNGPGTKKKLYNYFVNKKTAAMKRNAKFSPARFWGDKLVFSKIKARLGGRVRFICSGGAPLAKHVEEWLKVTMCCPVSQGYGLTETCAGSAVAIPGRDDQLGTVGPPMFSNEAKLDPVPDMGYDGSPEGGGEICFRGPSVMSGYYERPEATAEVLKDDGWFHTGDIGKFVNGGCIKIVDRKKQLFKLSQGEYVSPERVEGIAAKSQYVSQIFVHGTSTEAVLVAVVVPSPGAIAQYGGPEKAVKSEELKKEILADLDKVCRGEKLKGFEVPKGIILAADEFTPESGLVTPSFKLKRPTLRKHFEDDLNALYASMNA